MAKPTRPVNPQAPVSHTSDDPLENATLWLTSNGKLLGIGAALLAAVGLGIYGLRASDAKKSANASTALYAAQGPLQEGKVDVAQKALGEVATRYKGTSAGEQAVLLLAQSYYDAGQFAQGIERLEAARSGASSAFAAAMDVLIAGGYEGLADFEKAAAQYGKAATSAGSETERDGHVLSQARLLMRAGKRAEATALFEGLLAKIGSPYAQEAAVRLGELRASASAAP